MFRIYQWLWMGKIILSFSKCRLVSSFFFFLNYHSYIAEIRNPNSDIPMPDDLKGGKERMVFGNVEAIYEWHRE